MSERDTALEQAIHERHSTGLMYKNSATEKTYRNAWHDCKIAHEFGEVQSADNNYCAGCGYTIGECADAGGCSGRWKGVELTQAPAGDTPGGDVMHEKCTLGVVAVMIWWPL